MRRIFTDNIKGGSHILTGDEHKHLSIVLRAKKGQRVELCDGECGGDAFVYTGEIVAFSKESTTINIIDKRIDECEPRLACDLFLGIIKGAFLETAVQKSVELGVHSIHPLITENTVKTDLNIARTAKIALEAAKQCGRGRVPQILQPVKIATIYNALKEYDVVIFPYEKALDNGIKQFLDEFTCKNPTFIDKIKEGGARIAVVIGPEGGFSDIEAAELSKITEPISLGARILRADTACAAAITAVMYHFGELDRRGL